MSYDGIVTKAVVKELEVNLVGGRIDKVYQQEKDEILIHIHNRGTNHKLVLSSSSNNPRVYLAKYTKSNPPEPPMFCMLLRKHLIGGTVLNVEQFQLDRVILLDISSFDEFGQPSEKRLIVEIMGKHSNIILIDKNSLKIIDSVKRVSENMSRVRQVLPGIEYEFPPLQNKVNPLNNTDEIFMNLLNAANKNLPIFKFFYMNYMGLSPLISREICFMSNTDILRTVGSLYEEDIKSIFNSFNSLVDKINKEDFNPNYILKEDGSEIIAFHVMDINQFGSKNKYFSDSISYVLNEFYKLRDTSDRINQKSQSIKKTIQVKLDRTLNKLSKQKEELIESKDREKYKVYADLISANLYKIPKGIDSISLENYYDENMREILVPLDIKLSPIQNAQKYYKKYSKLKNAHLLLNRQIPETENEISYLENILFSIENSTEIEEINEIKEELIKENYIKGNLKKKKKENISKPLHYISSDGFHIYVGKNNKQNDYLTLKFAKKDDIWLHVQNAPGSHVIIKTTESSVPDSTLLEAANLAGFYSKSRTSTNVPIDFTQRKNIRKPKNAKPGMVIYVKYKTISISPSKENINKLQRVEE